VKGAVQSSQRYIADFDSATAMVRALANCLCGRDFPLLGAMRPSREPVMRLVSAGVNALPAVLREQVYIWSGWWEAIAPRNLSEAKLDGVCEWVTSLFPRRRYPAAVVGSSNGAAVHLWAALGIPWLPQTFLVPVARSGVHPDEPVDAMRWAVEPARAFLDANPEWELHHMHDPNQDRLMIRRMTYFRAKRLRLGAAYETFLRETLEPGAPIFLMECGLSWPTTRVAERHVFQFGALGGVGPAEVFGGGPRVAAYLAREGSHRRRWEPPEPDAERPEAEWGFAPELREDVERFAARHGYHVRRIAFEQPEEFSPLVADLYRWWNAQRGVTDRRLLVESFIVMEPFWTLRTGSTPFWMVFNKEPSAAALEGYLDHAEAFDEIYMMLFSHGVDSIGLVPIERWRALLARARKRGDFVGVDVKAYPRDFAVFVRYHRDLPRRISTRYPLPEPLPLERFYEFLARRRDGNAVRWL
jgi:hypothetical protein